jgi:hypothetical protein
MEGECRDCGAAFIHALGGGPRLYCDDCRVIRNRDSDLRSSRKYREAHPDKIIAQRRIQNRKRHRPRAEVVAESRQRPDAIMPKINALLEKGMSFAEVGPRLGLTRNAVAGLVHRHRRRLREGGQPCQDAQP